MSRKERVRRREEDEVEGMGKKGEKKKRKVVKNDE